MMTISVEQAQSSLRELIRRTSAGETVVITEGDEPVAEFRSVAAATPAPTYGSCGGMLTILAEDEEHLKDFAEYMK